MSDARIEGKISSTGYLHLVYNKRDADGAIYDIVDIVIMPKDEYGTISFTLPQGIDVTIRKYPAKNYPAEVEKTVTIPRSERVALSDLLK